MDPVTSFLLSFAASYLANVIPPFWQPGLDKRIHACFKKALGQWNVDVAAPYEGKEDQLKTDLLEYIKGEKPKNDELEELLANWVAAMKKDPICYSFYNEIKTNALAGQVVEMNESVVSRISERILSLEGKIDSIDEKTGEVLDVAKANNEKAAQIQAGVESIMSALTPTQFVCLNDCIRDSRMLPGGEISASSLTDKSFWPDEERISLVMSGLMRFGFFVIKGAEGRGKSVLSCQVAQRFIEEKGFTVFISERSWSWDKAYKELDVLLKGSGPKLVVLENIQQAADDISLILDYCKNHRGNDSDRHLFLMNTRLTDENESGSEINSRYCDFVLDLDDYQKIRAEMTAAHLAGNSGLNVDELTVEKNSLRDNLPPNLRVLSKFFQIYSETNVKDVDESGILHLFSVRFGLRKAGSEKRECLMKLSAINIFDVPLNKVAISDREYDILQGYEGLFYEQGGKLFLPHSTDAVYLCKALCDKNLKEGQELNDVYKERVKKTILEYLDALVRKHEDMDEAERDDISRDFLNLRSTLYSVGFIDLLTIIREPERAKVIVRTICPRSIVAAMRFSPAASDEEKERRLGIYLDSIDVIRANLLKFSFYSLSYLFWHLKHYGYERKQMVQDLFVGIDKSLFRDWLLNHGFIRKDQLFKEIKDTPELSNVIDEICSWNPGFFVNSFPHNKFKFLFRRVQGELAGILNDLNSGKVEIKDVSDLIEIIIRDIKDKLRSSPGQSSPNPLSHVLNKLGCIDEKCGTSFKVSFMNDEAVLNDARERLDFSGNTASDYYYFAHYYNDDFPEIRDCFKEIALNAADHSKRRSMKQFVCSIRNVYLWDKNKLYLEPFEDGTLAYDVERILLKEAFTTLAPFDYTMSSFFFIHELYFAYPDIKERVDELITNVTDNWKRHSMRIWIDNVRNYQESKGVGKDFCEGSLPAAIEKALNA